MKKILKTSRVEKNNIDSRSLGERFHNYFWWFAPISWIADIIAIVSALNTIGIPIIPSSQGANNAAGNDRIWGLAISDFVAITALFTLFSITAMIYASILANKQHNNLWPLICSIFASFILLYLFFRLWLGESWWVFTCAFPVIVLLFFLIKYFPVIITAVTNEDTHYRKVNDDKKQSETGSGSVHTTENFNWENGRFFRRSSKSIFTYNDSSNYQDQENQNMSSRIHNKFFQEEEKYVFCNIRLIPGTINSKFDAHIRNRRIAEGMPYRETIIGNWLDQQRKENRIFVQQMETDGWEVCEIDKNDLVIKMRKSRRI